MEGRGAIVVVGGIEGLRDVGEGWCESLYGEAHLFGSGDAW